MAAGYMQTAAMLALLEAGADPRLKDKSGRDVMLLVDNLRRSMPPSMNVLQRIMALEQVASGLTDRCGCRRGGPAQQQAAATAIWPRRCPVQTDDAGAAAAWSGAAADCCCCCCCLPPAPLPSCPCPPKVV